MRALEAAKTEILASSTRSAKRYSGASWFPGVTTSGTGGRRSRNARASANCSGLARWVKSPDATIAVATSTFAW